MGVTTKAFTVYVEVSGRDEENQDLQNLANYFEKSSEDTDEEKVDENLDENQDFWDQNDQEDQNSASKTKVDTFFRPWRESGWC